MTAPLVDPIPTCHCCGSPDAHLCDIISLGVMLDIEVAEFLPTCFWCDGSADDDTPEWVLVLVHTNPACAVLWEIDCSWV